MIALEDMTSDEATAMLEDSLVLYAEHLAASSDSDFETAAVRGRAVLARILADGVATPGHSWCWLVDAKEGRIGQVWLGPPEDGDAVLYVWALEIADAARGRGHGSAAIEAVVARAQQQGLDEVHLNVFAANEGARRLYRQHGFAVTNVDGGYVAMRRRVQAV